MNVALAWLGNNLGDIWFTRLSKQKHLLRYFDAHHWLSPQTTALWLVFKQLQYIKVESSSDTNAKLKISLSKGRPNLFMVTVNRQALQFLCTGLQHKTQNNKKGVPYGICNINR